MRYRNSVFMTRFFYYTFFLFLCESILIEWTINFMMGAYEYQINRQQTIFCTHSSVYFILFPMALCVCVRAFTPKVYDSGYVLLYSKRARAV